MAFDASVGGANSTSYVALAAAEAYFETRLSTDAWDEADESEQQAGLMMATARLDGEEFYGRPVTTTQRLQWPRAGLYQRNGAAYPTDAIPSPIQDATCELALVILADPDVLGGGASLSEFQNLRLGSLDVTPSQIPTSGALPINVQRLIQSLRIGGYMNRVVRA